MGLFTMSDKHDRDRDRQSLRDLAKLSQQTGPLSSSAPASVRVMPPPSSGVLDNSGLIDLERLSEAIRATSESKSETTLPPVAPVPESVATSPSAVSAPAAAPNSARTTGPANVELTPLSPSVSFIESERKAAPVSAAADATAAPAAPAAPASKVPMIVGGLVLVAAGAFFATRKEAAPVAAPAPAAAVAEPSPAAAAPAAPVPAAPEAKVEAPKVDEKPAAAPAKASAEAPKADEKPAPTAEAAPAKAAPAPAPAAPKGPKVEKSFADEMAAAVTGKLQVNAQPTESAAAGPAGPAAGMAKPSQGQVQAAFQKVKGAAHNCLGGQEIEVKTMVTFGSDGKVQKVAVSNAPDPGVGSCIEGAVNKANVPAFTDATFTAPLTVR